MNTSARAYARALKRGDLETARRIDAELDRQFLAANPESARLAPIIAEQLYAAQQQAACWSDDCVSDATHNPR